MEPDYAFLMYWAGLLFLILMLLSIALWGSMQSDFDGWNICNFCGPFYQIANFLFFYAGILHDVAFIRTAVVVANLFIAAFLLLGTSNWPDVWTSERACIRIDTLLWLVMAVAVNAIPLFRQVKFDDSKVTLENPEVTEAVWREWWRRSGIPRADFKEILQLADFIEATEGQQLPLKSFRGSNGWSESESESTEESCDSAIEWEEDVFYYIITGSVLLTPTPESGIKEVILDSGYFVDGPALMTALGQSSVVLAMQPLPPTAVVSEKTLLLRWTGRAVRQIITSSGFALECLRIVVASATLDSFYKNAVKEESLPTFQAVEAKRKELARAPLPKDAAMLQRSFFQQFLLFCLSHMTLRDLWEPSPRQRVINAIRTGSRQMVFRHHLHETFESMTRMHRAASIPLEGLPENRTTDLARLS